MRRVLVIQTWGIGDMVMTTPMLQALRAALPKAHLTVVAGSSAAADVIRHSDLCDEVRAMSFRTRSLPEILGFFVRIRFERFDAAIVATRLSSKIGFLLRFLSGLKVVAGDGVGSRSWGYTHWRLADLANHRSQSNLQILKLLFPHSDIQESSPTRFFLHESLESDMADAWRQRGLEGHVVMGLHPGCGVFEQDKKLPESWCWEVIARFLTAFPTGKVALFFGPEDGAFDATPMDISASVVRFQDMTIASTAAFIARTNVFLCGDTGLGHIAAAVGVPVVTVAGPTRIEQTRPVGGKTLIVKTDHDLPCMPCFDTSLFSKCPFSQKCMTTVSGQKVIDGIVTILKEAED